MLRSIVLASTLASCACAPGAALAVTKATMTATLSPERLGAPTTISTGFQISSGGLHPPVLTAVKLSYPHNLGFATSGLGLAACEPGVLEEIGPDVCPANSRMGRGSALVGIPLGGFLHVEHVQLAMFAAPSASTLKMLVSGVGSYPVSALVVLSAELLPGGLSIRIPPIPTLPEGPYVSLLQMHLELGGRLTYYERVGGRTIAYHPPGIALPRTCPRGGFRFAATFAFLGGRSATARTRVACPRP